MDKKISWFFMRTNSEQKELMRELATNRNMSMSAYIRFLVAQDEERYVRQIKNNSQRN